MTVQADTIRQSMPRPKASVPKMETRQSTTQGNLSGTCKGERQNKIFKERGKPHGEQELYDGGRSGTGA